MDQQQYRQYHPSYMFQTPGVPPVRPMNPGLHGFPQPQPFVPQQQQSRKNRWTVISASGQQLTTAELAKQTPSPAQVPAAATLSEPVSSPAPQPVPAPVHRPQSKKWVVKDSSGQEFPIQELAKRPHNALEQQHTGAEAHMDEKNEQVAASSGSQDAARALQHHEQANPESEVEAVPKIEGSVPEDEAPAAVADSSGDAVVAQGDTEPKKELTVCPAAAYSWNVIAELGSLYKVYRSQMQAARPANLLPYSLTYPDSSHGPPQTAADADMTWLARNPEDQKKKLNLSTAEKAFSKKSKDALSAEERVRSSAVRWLNKMSPDNYGKCRAAILEIPITTYDELQVLADQIFETALVSTLNQHLFADLCTILRQRKFQFDMPVEYCGGGWVIYSPDMLCDDGSLRLFESEEEAQAHWDKLDTKEPMPPIRPIQPGFIIFTSEAKKKIMEKGERFQTFEDENSAHNYAAMQSDFRRQIIGHCQREFEKERDFEELDRQLSKAREAYESCTGSTDEKRQLLLEHDDILERRGKQKDRMVANSFFIGELVKVGFLSPSKVLPSCFSKLSKENGIPDDADIHVCCTLFEKVGQFVEQLESTIKEGYFDQLAKLSKNPAVSTRIRFKCKDVLEARRNGWPVDSTKLAKSVHEVRKQQLVEDRERRQETERIMRRGGMRGFPRTSSSGSQDVRSAITASRRRVGSSSRRPELGNKPTSFTARSRNPPLSPQRKISSSAQESPTPSSPVTPVVELSPDEIERKVVASIEEYIQLSNHDELKQNADVLRDCSNSPDVFVDSVVKLLIKQTSAADRMNVCKAASKFMQFQCMTASQFYNALENFMQARYSKVKEDAPNLDSFLAHLLLCVLDAAVVEVEPVAAAVTASTQGGLVMTHLCALASESENEVVKEQILSRRFSIIGNLPSGASGEAYSLLEKANAVDKYSDLLLLTEFESLLQESAKSGLQEQQLIDLFARGVQDHEGVLGQVIISGVTMSIESHYDVAAVERLINSLCPLLKLLSHDMESRATIIVTRLQEVVMATFFEEAFEPCIKALASNGVLSIEEMKSVTVAKDATTEGVLRAL